MLLVDRSISLTPSRSSNDAMRLEIIDGCRCKLRAAAENDPARTIAMNAANSSDCGLLNDRELI
jgi:hypothetical protein